MQAQLVALSVGKPAESLVHHGRPVTSGMIKLATPERIALGTLGFEGDGQADTKHHGGPDKAVCVYCQEHYNYWSSRFNQELPNAAFGENLTTSGLLETNIHIGDIFELGEAVVQVTQPRQPCFKLAARYQLPEIPLWMQETGYTGYYFRVLTPGNVQAGQIMERVEADPEQLSISFANEVMHQKMHGREGLERLGSHPALSDSWRDSLTKRLAQLG
ncbi:MOSC domain-containing protein [Paenibacillus sp. 1001270B_150601_E10]|uniref:MOSC domain-containing protein n=1 Tax=Paenibacillus sp. 1001270B_150601_E10 TaxID=2787079 RepID=UPI00189DDE51|nr:MOSC domain-containing protein [Paenibacillus sp. 1001270B_150601_E10]